MASADLACNKDAIVRSATFGSGQDIHGVAGTEAGETLYTLLDFEALPAGVTAFTSAVLLLTRAPSGVHDSPDTGTAARLQRITGDWTEGNKGGPDQPVSGGEGYYSSNAVTWANKPAVNATMVPAVGGGGSQPSAAEVQWSITCTDIVNAWASGSAKKGIQVRSSNDVLDICFHSRHNATASKRPILRVTWSTAAANNKPTAPTVVVL